MKLLKKKRLPDDPSTKNASLVMYRADEDGLAPYVTWIETDDGARFWGHYFACRESAEADFIHRSFDLTGETA